MFWHLISENDMCPNRSENALSKDHKYVMQFLDASSVCSMELLTIIAVTWEDREVTLRRKNFKNFDIYYFWTKVILTLSVSEESVLKD